jgi:hypothetical protein
MASLIERPARICWRRGNLKMNLRAPISAAAVEWAIPLVVLALLSVASPAHAVILGCPPMIAVKAVGAPYPWSDAKSSDDAVLRFAEASYSCSNGTCTLSCAYAASNSIYTMLSYKVAPGVCHYTNDGRSFSCSSLPPPRNH